jgi:hypothetical protein
MKQLILILLLPVFGSSQTISQHLMEYNNSYSPLFGKDRANLKVTFEMIHVDFKDTTFYVFVDIGQSKMKVEGVLFNGSIENALGLYSNISMSLKNSEGYCLLDRNSLDSIITSFDNFLKISKGPKGFNQTVYSKINKIVLSLELFAERTEPSWTKKNFFILIDESSFKLSENEFEQLADNFKAIRTSWDTFLSTHKIVILY